MLSRRLFLGSLIGGATLAVAAPSLAMPSNRYQVLIEMQRTLYAANRENLLRLTTPGEVREYYRRLPAVQEKLNALLDYLLAEFNHTDLSNPAVVERVTRAMFVAPNTIDVMAEDDLVMIEDAVVVMTVVRHIMHVEHVQFTQDRWANVDNRYRMVRQPPTMVRPYEQYWWVAKPRGPSLPSSLSENPRGLPLVTPALHT